LHRLTESILPRLNESDSVQGDSIDSAVADLFAVPEKIDALLRVRNNRNHATLGPHNSIDAQRGNDQAALACLTALGWRRLAAPWSSSHQWGKRIPPTRH